MKPTAIQKFFASRWFFRIWFILTSLTTTILSLSVLNFRVEFLWDWRMLVQYLLIIVVSLLLGIQLGIFPGIIVLTPILYVRMRLNGGPFHVGDVVQVIGGPHDGTQTRIYAHSQGNSLHIDLGEEAKKAFDDIVIPTQIMRIKNIESS